MKIKYARLFQFGWIDVLAIAPTSRAVCSSQVSLARLGEASLYFDLTLVDVS